uniref:Peroxisomal membrane protein PEX14-like KPWE domain-containing protein n=1 Tax=Oreochromis niloticus TaxID=8128 RepID=A0A669B6J3_ORENI
MFLLDPLKPESSNISETSEPTETKQLSFAEVMRLVQEGKEVPGVTKVDIQPSNQNPTPSRMERMLKPWETWIGWVVLGLNEPADLPVQVLSHSPRTCSLG